ncbi:MAG: TIGR02996 domain-containing protein [Kofleriaceae bacterium]
MKRRYERRNEVLELELRGTTLVRTQTIGGMPPIAKTETFETEARARFELDLAIASGKGYVEVPLPLPPPILVPRDPVLERAIAEAPEDPAAYSVYADWLEAHGSPHGALIAMQLAIRTQSSVEQFMKFRDLEASMRRDHAVELLGPAFVHDLAHVELVWRYGYVDRVVIDERKFYRWRGADYDRHLALSNPAQIIASLLDSTCGWLVRQVTILAAYNRISLARLPSPYVGKINITVEPTNDQPENVEHAMSAEIMRVLNASCDVDLTWSGGVKSYRWVRPSSPRT